MRFKLKVAFAIHACVITSTAARSATPQPQNLGHAELRKMIQNAHGNELEYLRTFIRQIRMKIEDDPANPQSPVTDPHIGYRFNESVVAPPVPAEEKSHPSTSGIQWKRNFGEAG